MHQNIRLEHGNGDGDDHQAEDYFGVSVSAGADHEKTDYIDELDRLLSREEDKDGGGDGSGIGDDNGLLHLQPPSQSPPPILLSPPPAYRDTGDYSPTTPSGAIINTQEIPIQTTGKAIYNRNTTTCNT